MSNLKIKAGLISLLFAAAFTLTACGGEAPADTYTEPPQAEAPGTEETTVSSESGDAVTDEITSEGAAAETPASEEAHKETEQSSETSEATETAPQTTPALPWTEVPVSGILYINTDGIYSRAEAIQGSAKVRSYSINDTVSVSARTDTDYFKLEDGSFIHASYLSENIVEITEPAASESPVTTASAAPVTTALTAAATETAADTTTAAAATADETTAETADETTAETAAESSAETAVNDSGESGRRANTQAELDFAAKAFELINREREKAGVPAYQHLDVLDTIAAIRAWEISFDYRSDHIRPDGSGFTTAFRENDIFYGAWSENIAAGQTTPEEAVEAWLNSPPHKAAMLSSDYTHMGVGCYYIESDSQNYHYYWTLEFYRY